MSDLQDVIASNGIKAFNSGYERGRAYERERLYRILDELAQEDNALVAPFAYISDIKDYVEDEELK